MSLEKNRKVVKAWHELNNHHAFAHNEDLLYHSPIFIIDPVIENGYGVISDNAAENIHLRYWFEILIPYKISEEEKKSTKDTRIIGFKHVWELDDGADTYEDAILLIHKKITDKYGPA